MTENHSTPAKSTTEIRQDFLDYFASKDHQVVASSSLVPANDPTLLFTNAGMVQFKDVFLGAEKRPYKRAASSQRCVRAGGKHNDLDQVGYTARHHTFFEMLGNFSFGDYFKEEAIRYAWELLTVVYGLDPERLWVTVYETDDAAYDLWTGAIGVPAARVIRIGDKPGGVKFESDNFWAMGDTGPCGPCTEVFYDHGPEVPGGPPGSPDEAGDRYIEIWNLVFMQYDRAADGTMKPLPKPCVDTGMGLERIAAVLQGEHSNYGIDLFRALIVAAAELTGCNDLQNASLNVIADHIRACAFLISDGVVPARDGRGYVLRRIIRRAVRHGYKLGRKEPFFHLMVAPLTEQMAEAYPELRQKEEIVRSTLLEEEQRFARTLDTGMGILRDVMDRARADGSGQIDGETAFLLYDTYGFPLDLTQDIARENELAVDLDGFSEALKKQQARGRAAGKFSQQAQISTDVIESLEPTDFLGYERLETGGARISVILVDGRPVDELAAGEQAVLLLDKTPFYAESGGQVGDTGRIEASDARFEVENTVKLAGTFHGHLGCLKTGTLHVGDVVSATVDAARRRAIVLHHSATHLMHAALKQVLGDHVEQRGSLVARDHLRFDFTHPRAVTEEELREIERLVNREIRMNPASEVQVMAFDDALQTGATALFGEKYGDHVRVLRFGDFSVELCGGTHVERVGDIGQFKILEESAIAAGIRRIVAVAGEFAVEWIQNMEGQLRQLARTLKIAPEALEDRLGQLLERNRSLERELDELKSKLASASGEELADRAVAIDGIKVLSARLDGVDPKALRDTVDRLRDRLGDSVIVIGSAEEGKVRIAAGVSKNLVARIQAGNLVNFVAQQVGGRGGGRPDFAQAGGSQPENLDGALASVQDWVSEHG
ncbi:MAG: alanine--tRNA ligase [Xanthomonadales bacterium]|nr:alanine--tRNA ligase [Xanthomonadales bacterium]